MTTAWMAGQLSSMAEARRTAPDHPRFNPRPAGMVRPGGASDAVLALMVEKLPARPYLTHAQLVRLTNRTTKSVSWAVIYLRSLDLIEATADDGRNCRYQRYRITEEGIRYASSRP